MTGGVRLSATRRAADADEADTALSRLGEHRGIAVGASFVNAASAT